jgi:putative alpha-1,2-mannosidase
MQVSPALGFSLGSLSLASGISAAAQYASNPHDAVDPLIGTSGGDNTVDPIRGTSAGGGNTFPGASLPFGMVQWSPDTNHEAWCFYNDKQTYGFSLTHLSGAGCALYGDFAVLPTTVSLTSSPGANLEPYAAPFDHSKEEAPPGCYAVTLANGIRVEITVAERYGIARFIFPAGVSARLLVNAGSSANTQASQTDGLSDRDVSGNRIELKTDDLFAGSVMAGRAISQ